MTDWRGTHRISAKPEQAEPAITQRKPSHACIVTIRSTTYPSLSAAARALGVSVQAVWDAVERGNTDGVGLGRNWWRKKSA